MARLPESQVDAALATLWRDHGWAGRAPTVRDLWVEQCRVASADGGAEPLLADLVEHFSWFFGRVT